MEFVKKNAGYLTILSLILFVYVPLFYVGYPVQDECHFFDPVYELFDTGRWAAPYNYYLGGGIEKTAYGHPPSNGLYQAFVHLFTQDGFLTVRIAALLAKIFAAFSILYILKRLNVHWLIAVLSVFIFCLHNYAVLNVVRPDILGGTFLLLFSYFFYEKKYWLAIVFWAIAVSFHQIMAIAGTIFYAAYILQQYKGLPPKKWYGSKQFFVPILAAIGFVIIWFTPILWFNGVEGLQQVLQGTTHHLGVVDRLFAWYTDSFVQLVMDQLPYYIVLLAGLIFCIKNKDIYIRSLTVLLWGILFFVMAKTVNTSWYYYMFSPVYAVVFGFVFQNYFKKISSKNNQVFKWGAVVFGVVLLLFIIRTRHTSVFVKYPLEAFFNKTHPQVMWKEIIEKYPSDSRVLSSPQYYHIVRPHFKESFDLENYGKYGPPEDLLGFDYIFLMEEHPGKGALHRFPPEKLALLNQHFEEENYDDITKKLTVKDYKGNEVSPSEFKIYKKKNAE